MIHSQLTGSWCTKWNWWLSDPSHILVLPTSILWGKKGGGPEAWPSHLPYPSTAHYASPCFWYSKILWNSENLFSFLSFLAVSQMPMPPGSQTLLPCCLWRESEFVTFLLTNIMIDRCCCLGDHSVKNLLENLRSNQLMSLEWKPQVALILQSLYVFKTKARFPQSIFSNMTSSSNVPSF